MKAKLVFAVAVALCVTVTDAYGDIFAASDRGSWTGGGTSNNAAAPPGGREYNVSSFGFGPSNAYFAFNRSGWAGSWVVSASFRVQSLTTTGGTIGLFDYIGDQTAVRTATTGGAAIFADLGAGTSYGTYGVGTNVLQTIALNAAALDAIRNGSGSYFIMGAAISPANRTAYFDTDMGGPHETSLDLVLQANTGPTAVTNGPYVYNPGFNLFLDGSASFDPDEALGDSIVSWEWDVNGDGIYDFSGETYDATWTELMAAGISPDNVYNLALRVTDTLGEQGITMVTLTVTAVPEPATCIIWALTGGTVGLVNMRRRRKARAAA